MVKALHPGFSKFENMQASGPCAQDPWPFKPKISRFHQTVEDY